jgi:hypothetical protein
MPTPMIWPAITGLRLASSFPAPSPCPRPSSSTDNSVYVGYPQDATVVDDAAKIGKTVETFGTVTVEKGRP